MDVVSSSKLLIHEYYSCTHTHKINVTGSGILLSKCNTVNLEIFVVKMFS